MAEDPHRPPPEPATEPPASSATPEARVNAILARHHLMSAAHEARRELNGRAAPAETQVSSGYRASSTPVELSETPPMRSGKRAAKL